MSDSSVFDRHALDYDVLCEHGLSISGESKSFFACGRVEALRKWVERENAGPIRRVLDFGCGVGDVAPILREAFANPEVAGIDQSHRCVERARNKFAAPGITFATVDDYVASSPPPVDLLHVNGLLHHVPPPDRPRLLRRMASLVRKGGCFAVFENNPYSLAARLVMARMPFDRDAIMISHMDARRLLEDNGFRVTDIVHLFFFPRFLKWLRGLDPFLARVPLGAQYGILGAIR